MRNKNNRALVTGLFAVIYTLPMFLTTLLAYVAALDAEDIRAFVEFEKLYPDAENDFLVWGDYSGAEETEIQIISAVYDAQGKLEQTKIGAPVKLMPNAPFAITDGITLDADIVTKKRCIEGVLVG